MTLSTATANPLVDENHLIATGELQVLQTDGKRASRGQRGRRQKMNIRGKSSK